MTVLVSVVVSSLHRARFLGETLGSIGTPAIPSELIVIEEDSIDLAAARNRGLGQSQGEFILFLDAGDKLAPGAIELGAAQLEQHPEAAFVYGRSMPMDLDGTLMPAPVQPRIARDHYRELLRRNFIPTPAVVMFRRDTVKRSGGYNPRLDGSADYDLYLHIARHRPVHDHGQVVAFQRSVTAEASGSAARLRETLAVLRSQRPFLLADAASLAAYADGWRTCQELYGSTLVQEIRAGLRNGEWLSALRNTAALGRHHPRGLWHHARRLTRLPHRFGGGAMPASGG